MDYQIFKLKQNPFSLTLPLKPQDIIWVGLPNLKKQFEKLIQQAMYTSVSRIVINYGDYGTGKTYVANYYTKTNHLQHIANELNVSPAYSLKVNLPRTSEDIVQAFWRALLGQISFQNLVENIALLKKETGTDFQKIVARSANDNIIERLFLTLPEKSEDELEAIQNYLYNDKTKQILQEELLLGLVNDEQIVNLISTVFNCLTYEKKIYSTILLWIDEFQDIDMISKSLTDRFTTFLRQLVDKTPNNMTIFLNFTPKRFIGIDNLSVYLGETLSNRAKLRIHFDKLTVDEALIYIKDLLKHFLFQENVDKQPENLYYPFSEEIARYVLNHIGQLTIRKINEVFSLILELALIEGEEKITIGFIQANQIELT